MVPAGYSAIVMVLPGRLCYVRVIFAQCGVGLFVDSFIRGFVYLLKGCWYFHRTTKSQIHQTSIRGFVYFVDSFIRGFVYSWICLFYVYCWMAFGTFTEPQNHRLLLSIRLFGFNRSTYQQASSVHFKQAPCPGEAIQQPYDVEK